MINVLEGISGIGIARLEASDIVRNPIIADIINRLEEYDNRS